MHDGFILNSETLNKDVSTVKLRYIIEIIINYDNFYIAALTVM